VVVRDPAGLFPYRLAGRGFDAGNNDIANFTLGMTADNYDFFRQFDDPLILCIETLTGNSRMLKLYRPFVVCLSLLFFGSAVAQDEGVAPPADDETLIYVIREGRFAGSMNKMWIAVNNNTVARVENDAYAVVRVPAGHVTLNLATAGIVAGAVAVDDRPGESVYLRWRLGDFFLTELDADEGAAVIAGLERTPPIDELRPNNERVQANFALDMLGLGLTHPTTEMLEPDDEHAVVTVFRRDKKELVRVALWSNDGYKGMLELNQGTQFRLPAGEHHLFAGLIPDTTVVANVEAGNRYYVSIDIGMVKIKVEPVAAKEKKKLDKWLKKVEWVALDPALVTGRVHEREEIVLEFLRAGDENGLLDSEKINELGEKHIF
jgi:hypothetical protein